jgi:RNA polymerase sigma-B factor
VSGVGSGSIVRAAQGAANRRDDSVRLLERYHRERDRADRDALVVRFLPLARHLARGYRGVNDRDDLEQVAALGLVKALDRFDPTRGVAFSSFAVPTILGELRRHFRDLGWSVRVPRALQELAVRVEAAEQELTGEFGCSPSVEAVAERCGASTEQVLEARATATAHFADSLDRPARDDDGANPEIGGGDDPGYAQVEVAVDLEQLLAGLSERERTVLRLRFHEDLLQREIAARMGISQMHVSRLITRAIAALQHQRVGAARPLHVLIPRPLATNAQAR